MDPRHVTVAERFRAAGYETVGFFCCRSFFAPEHSLGLVRGISRIEIEKEGATLARSAREFLRARRADEDPDRPPLFLWMHVLEPHAWNKRHPAMRTRSIHERYDQSLGDVDQMIGYIIDGLGPAARTGGADGPIIVVTSDHGEGLMEHGTLNHARGLYQSQVHVPLVIVGPDLTPRRVAQPVGLVDLAPTLLDLAGFVPPGMPEMDGVSLAPLARGDVASDANAGEAYALQLADRSVATTIRAILVGRLKLIVADGARPELYDVVSDPGEKNDLAAAHPAEVERLRERLRERMRIDRISPFVD
jgi:arylsulfatase A-like enzyme